MSGHPPSEALAREALKRYAERVTQDAQSRMARMSAVYHVTEHMTPEQLQRWLASPAVTHQQPE